MLQNGGTTVDASTLSYDHAVPVDPLVAERIEVVRGPAALMYGGNAIGGVVNVIDNRIPKEPIEGIGGAVDASATAGGDQARNASALIEAGNGKFAVHADAFARKTSDLRIPATPAATACAPPSRCPKARPKPMAACPTPARSRKAARWAAPTPGPMASSAQLQRLPQ